MHQPLSDESLILPTTHQLLNPNIKRALGVLDARLEDELARYRRYRKGLRVAPSAISVAKRSANKSAPKSSPVMPSFAQPSQAQPSSAPQIQQSAQLAQLAQQPVAQQSALPPTASVNPEVAAATPLPPLPPRTAVSLQNDASEMLAISLAAQHPDSTSANATSTTPSTTQLSADDLPQDGFLTDQTPVAYISDEAPSDYLESSEELLRSLAEEEATAAVERNVLEGLLTPFGVGSMMLMLLGSGMFGYLIMNPASLNALKGLVDRVVAFRSRPANISQSNPGTIDILGSASTDPSWRSNAPALDSDEFLSLSLDNFSALRTRPGGNGLTAISPLSLIAKDKMGPAQKKPNQKDARKAGIASTLKNFAPLAIKPLVPPAPTIGGESGGMFAPSGRVAKSYEGGGGSSYGAAPQAPAPIYEAPRRPVRSYEPPAYREPSYSAPSYSAPAPSYSAPARSYDPPEPKAYTPPASVPTVELPPPPTVETTTPQGDYRVVTPYTNDAALEAAQKADPTASFRNLEDGAYIQRGGSYSSKEEAEAKANELKQQGIEVEVK